MRPSLRSLSIALSCTLVGVTVFLLVQRSGWLHDGGAPAVEDAMAAALPVAATEPATLECLPTGNGFFRARLDGALEMDLDWKNRGMACEGMPRPNGDGIRLSFRRPQRNAPDLLILLGIAGLGENSSGRALPVNVTIIEEGSDRIYGTLGDDKCTIDELRQDLVTPARPDSRSYRVTGRGFCVGPASAVSGTESVLMSTFDFAGIVTFEDESAPAPEGPV